MPENRVSLVSPADGSTVAPTTPDLAATNLTSCQQAGYPVHQYDITTPTGRQATITQAVTPNSSLIYLQEQK